MKGKRRLLEAFKSLLIVLLSLSAVYLLIQTPLIQDSGVLDLFESDSAENPQSSKVTLTTAARPSRMAVSSGGQRFGIQYDQNQTDELFARFGPLLGEALVSSEQPEELPEEDWQRYLQGDGIFFDFVGEVPLSALSSWLQPEGACILTSAARRILLAGGENDSVLLCYQDMEEGEFYGCPTGLSWSLHMESAVSAVSGNGAHFAFERESWAELLEPYTLITEETARPVYAASIPVSPGGNHSALLEALGYTGRNHASVSGGELYLDGNDRLHIFSGGRVVYTAAQLGKYPVATARGMVTVAEAIESARRLAEGTVGAQCGEAQLYLMSARATEDGYVIRFGYRLNGSTVWLYHEGWAAEFIVRDGYITEFTLYFRSYLPTGENAMLLSMDWTAAMIPSLTGEQCELNLQYRDGGEDRIEPIWVAK